MVSFLPVNTEEVNRNFTFLPDEIDARLNLLAEKTVAQRKNSGRLRFLKKILALLKQKTFRNSDIKTGITEMWMGESLEKTKPAQAENHYQKALNILPENSAIRQSVQTLLDQLRKS